ncbi:MAG: hypothetical protein IKN31_06490 [Bacteroidales bacterium]|nr:hypothetical protein [Bacteroidales bacterium]
MQYIVDLFRDGDPAVTAALERYFLDNGPEPLQNLRECYRIEMDLSRKELLGRMLGKYGKKAAIAGFKRLAEQCRDGECCMLEAGYLLALLTDPTIAREDYMEKIMPPAVAVMAEISDAKTGVENVHLLNHIFYNRYGFSSSNPFDMSLEGSLLMDVLEKRKGSPLVLSLVYFMVAQAAGLPIYPLCFTGGFVPVYVENDRVLFNINVFHKGEIFIENDISKLVKNQASALGVNVDIGEAKVRRDASILVMYLEFLQMLYSNAGNSSVQMDIEDAIEALGGTRFLTVEEDDDNW